MEASSIIINDNSAAEKRISIQMTQHLSQPGPHLKKRICQI